MQISLMIEGQEGVTWEEWVRLAELCEQFGYEGLIRSDHATSLFAPSERGSLDAWTTIAGLATLTSRIRLGTMVSPVSFRHPAHLARVVAAADHISDGRVQVGIGAGWYGDEHRTFGFDFPNEARRMAKLDEYVEVVHLLLTESGPVDFAGEHYRLDAACLSPRPVQKPRPPIVLGGLAGPKAAAVAARFADEYNLHGTAPADVAPKRARLQAACDALGRDPSTLRLSINGNVLVGTGPDDLALRSRRHAAYQGLVASSPADYLAGLDSSCLVGTPDRLLEQVAAYADAGVGRVLMQVFPHDDYEAISIIGSEIVPAARSMTSRGEPSPGEEGRSDDN